MTTRGRQTGVRLDRAGWPTIAYCCGVIGLHQQQYSFYLYFRIVRGPPARGRRGSDQLVAPPPLTKRILSQYENLECSICFIYIETPSRYIELFNGSFTSGNHLKLQANQNTSQRRKHTFCLPE